MVDVAPTVAEMDAVLGALRRAATVLEAGGTEHVIWPEYADDPVGFFQDKLNAEVWESERHLRENIPGDILPILGDPVGQADICDALVESDFVAVAGAKGLGKTWLEGRLPLWWLKTRPNATCILISASHTQLTNQVFAQMATALDDGEPLGGGPIIWSPAPRWSLSRQSFALGLSPASEDQVRGWHAKAHRDEALTGPMLIVVDEASSEKLDKILPALWGLLTNPGSKMAWFLNTTRARGEAYELWHPPMGRGAVDAAKVQGARRIKTMRITAYDAPRWVIGEDYLRTMEEKAVLHGGARADSTMFRCDVLSLFPTQEESLLIPASLLESRASLEPRIMWGRHMGVDIARSGDFCVAYLMEDGRIIARQQWGGTPDAPFSLMRTAQIIRGLAMGETWHDPDAEDRGWEVAPENVHIDATAGSMGVGVLDKLRDDMGLQVDGVDFSESPDSQRAYWEYVVGTVPKSLRTMRQFLHWLLRRLLDECYVSIPRHPEFAMLWDDATHVPVEMGPDGATKVPAKQKLRELLGRSTDDLDACLCALSRPAGGMARIRSISRYHDRGAASSGRDAYANARRKVARRLRR